MAHEAGQQMAADNAGWPCPHQLRRDAEILLAQRQQFRSYGAGKSGPIQKAEDNGDTEEDDDGTPIQRQDRRQRQPQGQVRQAAQDLNQALHAFIKPAAVVARQSAEQNTQDEAGADAKKSDGQGYARAIDEAREHVLAYLVGPEQVELPPLRRADEVKLALEQAPKAILVPLAEKAKLLDFVLINGVFAPQRLRIQLELVAIDKRADELPVMEQVHRLRRRQNAADILGVLIVGRDEFANQDRGVEGSQEYTRHYCRAMAQEAPPHELPLGGQVVFFLPFGHPLHRIGVEGFAGDIVGDRLGAVRSRCHGRAPILTSWPWRPGGCADRAPPAPSRRAG